LHFGESRRTRFAGLHLISAAVLFTLTALAGVADSKEINDLDISLAVDTQLDNDSGVPAQMIDVQTRDGVVTLSGSVPHLLARERADDVAATVKGVRAIINQIDVLPVARTDDLIRREVETALLEDPAADLFEITAAVRDGVVTLDGTVDSWQEKQLCLKVAGSVRGVKEVRSEIAVAQVSPRPDDEIEDEIERKLSYDMWVRDDRIKVRVLNGHVILSGIAGSLAEKKRAFRDAWVAGVVSVVDADLQVEPLPYDDDMRRAAKPALKPDADVRQAVADAFAYDPRLSGVDLQIAVDSGIVTLTGRVGNLAAKQAAEHDAKNTVGVWQVKNHVKVRPDLMGPQRRPLPDVDAELARKARSVLARHPYVQQPKIGVSVNNRLVVLSGTVDSDLAKKAAADAVSGVRGVAEVVNNLTLSRNWTPKDDWQIYQDIKNELWWSPFVDPDDITVSVLDGAATLIGVVDTLRDRHIATVNALEGGARQVRNHLKVRFGPEGLRP